MGRNVGSRNPTNVRRDDWQSGAPVPQISDIGATEDVIETCYRFGLYEVIPGVRLLRREGREISLGSRAFDLLVVLLRSRGNIVTKEEIFGYVWPGTVVEDSNLRVQVTFLKRALKSDRGLIKCIQGRGYLFVAESDQGLTKTSTGIELPATSGRHAEERSLEIPCQTELNQTNDTDEPEVVVIDDDKATREALESLLQSAGLRVDAFSSVKAYVASARSVPPACLVLDVLMPGQSGLAFQEDLAKTGVSPPVIFISGNADIHMSVRAMKAGAIEFLTKPVRHEELIEAIRLAIASTRSRPTPHNRGHFK
jgi:DNA-binding response OmpR family regulator